MWGRSRAWARTGQSVRCLWSFCVASSFAAAAIAQPEATSSSSRTGDIGTLRVRDAKVPDLGCSEAGAAVDAIVDDECAADAAANGDIEDG